MRIIRNFLAITLFVIACAGFNISALADTESVSLRLGDSYQFTNTDITSSTELKVNTATLANDGRYDVAIYEANGEIDTFSANTATGYFTIPAGGTAIVTVVEGTDVVKITEIAATVTHSTYEGEALENLVIKTGESYTFSNPSITHTRTLKAEVGTSANDGAYDIAVYTADGDVHLFSYETATELIFIPPGGKAIITAKSGIENLIFSAPTDSLNIEASTEQALQNVEAKANESYTFVNQSLKFSHTIRLELGTSANNGSYDVAVYNSTGEVRTVDAASTTSMIYIPPGGKAVVTVKSALNNVVLSVVTEDMLVEQSEKKALQNITIKTDESYEFSNTSLQYGNVVKVALGTTANNAQYDVAVYDSKGDVIKIDADSKDSFITIPIGGKAIVTVKSEVLGVIFSVVTDEVTYKKTVNPALENVKLQVNESYTFVNTSLLFSNDIQVNRGTTANNGKYNVTVFEANGEQYSMKENSTLSSFTIPVGGKAVVTVSSAVTDIQFSGAYSVFGDPIEEPEAIPVTAIQLDRSAVTLNVGEKATVKATVAPSNATDKSLTWASSNTSIAKVDTSGNITAVAAGSTKIVVTSKDGKIKAEIAVKVTKPVEPTEPSEPDQDYKIWEPQLNVEKNKTWTLDFALPFDPETIVSDNIYIVNSANEVIAQSFIYSDNGTSSTLKIKPVKNYTPGETYTLYIKNVLGTNGEKLKQFVKMDFTIKQDENEVTNIQ